MTPPVGKTKFVRPLCETNNSGNFYAGMTSPIQPVHKNANLPGIQSIGDNLKHMNEMKSKQLDNLNSVHCKLFAGVEEIQKWKTTIEMESMQKNKKVEELSKTIETQRKVILDLQLQVENLNYRLSEEVQQRSFVFEKFHSTKELSSALKKHYDALQKQFDYRNNIEDMIKTADAKRIRAIEVLENKYEKICVEHSERIGYLNDALATETNKSLNLKEDFERELSIFENEKQSLCTLLNNSQQESERLSKNLDEEISKSRTLLQEKRELELKLVKSEKLNETHLSQIQEMEVTMKATEEDKLEMEKKYLSENLQNSELKRLYEESLEKYKCLKMESEENLLALRQTNEELENKYTDLLKRMEELNQKNLDLSSSLQKAEDDKCHLNTVIVAANDELCLFENLKNDYKDLKENFSQLLGEKAEVNVILENTKDELSKVKSEYENTLKLYEEKNEELLRAKTDYEAKMCLKDKEILCSSEDNKELLSKCKTLEEDGLAKSELVISKDKEIAELQALLEENNTILESVKNDNVVLKENYELERESAKVCLECERLQDKVRELETIKTCLKETEEELMQQKRNTNDIKKMLYESEKISNDDRIKKQREIIQYKSQLQILENEIPMKYVERERFDVLSSENIKLKKDLEEIEIKLQKLQVECLNASLNKTAVKLDKFPKEVMMTKSPNEKMTVKSPKQSIADVFSKETMMNKSSKQAKAGKSPKPAMAGKSPKLAMAEKSPKLTMAGKSPKLAMAGKSPKQAMTGKSPKLAMHHNEGNDFVQKTRKNEEFSQNVKCKNKSEYSYPDKARPSELDFCFEKTPYQENKAWDANSSSGSEYLDISVLQEKEAASTPKEHFKTQDSLKNNLGNKFSPHSQQKRESQDVSDNNMAKRPCIPYKTQTQFKSSIWTQGLKTPERKYQEQNHMNKQSTPLASTPATQRKFFKSTLLERENKFKKPREPWI